jgi:catechol 2,3-dioxygenase-like lactoylglutathione lyase family enzyme
MAIFDHLTLTVRDLQASSEFYARALRPLGLSKQRDYGEMLAFGPEGRPAFWLKAGPTPQSSLHLAFRTRDRAAVDGFHAEALKAGGQDDGAPGLREHYHPNYYGAFVIDPDGHHIEAVCHLPLGQQGPPAQTGKPRAAPKKKKKTRPAAKAKRKPRSRR